MTSMPASRSARAITLAPRSCPSRPGLAMTTRIFCTLKPDTSNYRRFFVFSPDVPQRVAHFAHGCIGPHGVNEQRHRVGRTARPILQGVQRGPNARVVARLPQLIELAKLPFRG